MDCILPMNKGKGIGGSVGPPVDFPRPVGADRPNPATTCGKTPRHPLGPRSSVATQTDERQGVKNARQEVTSLTDMTSNDAFNAVPQIPAQSYCFCRSCLSLSTAKERHPFAFEDYVDRLSEFQYTVVDGEDDDDGGSFSDFCFDETSNLTCNEIDNLNDDFENGSEILMPTSPRFMGRMTVGVSRHSSTDIGIVETSSNHNDSGIGRTTDESVKADDSNCSEQEMLDSFARLPCQFLNSCNNNRSSIRFLDFPFETAETVKDGGTSITPNSDCQDEIDFIKKLNSVNNNLQQLHLNYRPTSFDVNKRKLIGCSTDGVHDSLPSPTRQRLVPRMGTRRDFCRPVQLTPEQPKPPVRLQPCKPDVQDDQIWIRNTDVLQRSLSTDRSPSARGTDILGAEKYFITSDYNSADSSCCTPLLSHKTVSPLIPEQKFMSTVVCGSQTRNSDCCQSPGDSMMSNVASQTVDLSDAPQLKSGVCHLQKLYTQYVDVMYTNPANLEHTMMIQQKLFNQQMQQNMQKHSEHEPKSGLMTKSENSVDLHVSQPVHGHPNEQQHIPMEWVVKRRSDGSRYIARRPVRRQILKDRAQRLAEERCGVTTDDDASSELKLGRYWSRDKRRLHLEKARRHREQKELMQRQKMETVRENDDQPNIIELSRRKVNRHRSKRVLDSFITVQEMLAHGNQDPFSRSTNPLLSVTTV